MSHQISLIFTYVVSSLQTKILDKFNSSREMEDIVELSKSPDQPTYPNAPGPSPQGLISGQTLNGHSLMNTAPKESNTPLSPGAGCFSASRAC